MKDNGPEDMPTPDSGHKRSRDPLLEPLTVKHLVLKNRIMSTSHAASLDDDFMPRERYQRYHEEKAKGGLALTMFGGSAMVSRDSNWGGSQMPLYSDEIIPLFQQFSDRIHQHGAALMVQASHLGRRADSTSAEWLPNLAPSALREVGHRSFSAAMDEHDIARIVKDYGQAARRCYEGGLDGLETMTGGHLIGQFLSPLTNLRDDRFGGSLENRARFGLMVHDEIRKQVGDDFLVGIRFDIDEDDPHGLGFEEACQVAEMYEREGLVDFFNCIFGRLDTQRALLTYNIPNMAQPLAPFVERVGAFKASVKSPVFHAAKIADIASARHAVAEGLLDMVGMTRAHIADPQIVNKLAGGEEERIRPCVGASHCLYKRVACIHNAATGRETRLPQVVEPTTGTKRKVVVVGGGPAGLEAARVSAERGHEVVLFEAAPRLGGQILLAGRAGWRRDLLGIVDWREKELEHLGVTVRTNAYAEASDVLAEEPDVVIVATGGLPDMEFVEGGGLCDSTWDVLGEPPAGKQDFLVFDGTGRHPAPSTATHLAAQGHKVRLITRDSDLAPEMEYQSRVYYRKQIAELGIPVTREYNLVKVERGGNGFKATLRHELTDVTLELEAERIVLDHGTTALDEVFQEMREQSANGGITDIDALIEVRPQPGLGEGGYHLFRIGDAVTSRSIHAAIYDATRLCVTV